MVESMYVVNGGVTVEPEEPERTGYWFEGWYQNEELTFRFANGNDWWFHAKGVPGSM